MRIYLLIQTTEPGVGIEPTLNSLPMNRFTTKLCRRAVLGGGLEPPQPLWASGLQPEAIAATRT